MKVLDWMQEGSFDIADVPYRHNRFGMPRRMGWSLGAIMALISFLFLVSGAIVTAIALTEVRPPAADENYNRYLGSDVRRIVGPLLIIMAFVIFGTGALCVLLRTYSHRQDKKYMAMNDQQFSHRKPTRPQEIFDEEN